MTTEKNNGHTMQDIIISGEATDGEPAGHVFTVRLIPKSHARKL